MRLCDFRKEHPGNLQIERIDADELSKDGGMAVFVEAETGDLMKPPDGSSGAAGSSAHRRRVSFEAGHALELLGHAIEYLTDEYVHGGGDFSAHDPRLEAIQLLMALNRKVYFECPEALSFGERCRTWLHLRAA